MSRYTGYNQRGFANSTVAITRAASGNTTSINYSGVGSTTLYLPFDDDVNDDSPLSQTITNRGSMTVDSTYAKFGSKSLKSETSGSLKIDNSASTDLDGSFTIEFFLYVVTHENSKTVYTHNDLNGTFAGALFWFSGGVLRLYASSNGSNWNILNNSALGSISTDAWHHVAFTYDGSTYRAYVDGTRKWEVTSSTTLPTGGNHYIFSRTNAGQYRPSTGNQYLDDFRITKGVALYTGSTYTVPTSALGLYDNNPVSLYLPFDSDVNDDSPRSHTVTASGGAAISSTQSKFGGNSLALDGTNDYLTIASGSEFQDFNSQPFTIEGFFYCTNDSSSSHNIIMSTGTGSNNWNIAIKPDNKNFQFYDGTTRNATGVWTVNTWHHFAVCFDGSTLLQFIDGTQIRSDSYSNLTSSNADIDIGRHAGGSNNFNGYLDDLRIIKGAARYTKNFIPPSQAVGAKLTGINETNTTTDFTSLYLPFDSDINDDSSHSHSVTASGGAAVSSAQSKFGGYSLALDGSGDYLTIPHNSNFEYGAGAFTIEFWMYPTSSVSGDRIIYNKRANNGTYGSIYIAVKDGNIVAGATKTGSNWDLISVNTAFGSVAVNTWYHVALVRNSDGSFVGYLNGVGTSLSTDDSSITSNSTDVHIGGDTNTYHFSGYLDDFRIVKGYSKYTADFVPPTSAVGTSVSETVNDLTVLYLPFDSTVGSASVPSSQVSLYLPFDSDIGDDSSYAHNVAAGGGAAISSSYSKFGGNSLYLDGSDDRLSFGDDGSFEFGSGDFTMEAFIYPTNLSHHSLTKVVLGKFSGQGSNMAFVFGVSNTNYLQFFYSTTGNGLAGTFTSSTTQITTNQWYHIAVTRKGSTGYLFVDGNLETTFSFTSSIANVGTHLLVGAAVSYGGSTPGGFFAGYIDDVRVIKGTALYISSFTPPSSALGTSATAPTVIGGFEDLARNHGVTKNGGPTPSTSVKKFGTSSMYFPAQSDYIEIPGGHFDFGSDDFTIEGWFYDNGSGGGNNVALDYRIGSGVAGSGSETFGFLFYLNSSGNGKFYIGLEDDASSLGIWPMFNSSSLAISTNTWTHYAFTREGSTFRAFKDGSLIATQSGVSSAVGNSTGDGAMLRIGSTHASPGSNGMAGYIDDLRIIRGKAKYTAAFTPPASAHGHVSLLETTSTSENYSDSKFLSGIWDMTDVRDKMMQSTWVSNDTRITNGAGLQVSGHRWYIANLTPIAWDTTTKGSNVVISNSDMTAGISGVPSGWPGTSAVSVGGHSSGKIYFEATISGTQGSGYLRIGVVQNKGSSTYSEIQSDSMGGWDSNAPAYANKSENRSQYNGGQVFDNSHSPANGDVFMWAFDIDNARVYFGHNGSFDLSFDPVNGTGGYDMSALPGYSSTHPWLILFQNNGASNPVPGTVTLRTAAEAQYLPSGYSYWGTVE